KRQGITAIQIKAAVQCANLKKHRDFLGIASSSSTGRNSVFQTANLMVHSSIVYIQQRRLRGRFHVRYSTGRTLRALKIQTVRILAVVLLLMLSTSLRT